MATPKTILRDSDYATDTKNIIIKLYFARSVSFINAVVSILQKTKCKNVLIRSLARGNTRLPTEARKHNVNYLTNFAIDKFNSPP